MPAGRPQAGRRGTDFATLFEPKPVENLAKIKDFRQNGRPNGAMTMTRSEPEIPSPAEAKKLFPLETDSERRNYF